MLKIKEKNTHELAICPVPSKCSYLGLSKDDRILKADIMHLAYIYAKLLCCHVSASPPTSLLHNTVSISHPPHPTPPRSHASFLTLIAFLVNVRCQVNMFTEGPRSQRKNMPGTRGYT